MLISPFFFTNRQYKCFSCLLLVALARINFFVKKVLLMIVIKNGPSEKRFYMIKNLRSG